MNSYTVFELLNNKILFNRWIFQRHFRVSKFHQNLYKMCNNKVKQVAAGPLLESAALWAFIATAIASTVHSLRNCYPESLLSERVKQKTILCVYFIWNWSKFKINSSNSIWKTQRWKRWRWSCPRWLRPFSSVIRCPRICPRRSFAMWRTILLPEKFTHIYDART